MQEVSLIDKFITEGNERAGEPAKEGAMLDGGEMAQVRATTIQQEREEVHAALQHAASFHCLVEEWKDGEEHGPKPKEQLILSAKKRGKQRSIARSGVRQQTNIG